MVSEPLPNASVPKQPHPFLTGAILYLLDVPPRVRRENIKAAFQPCGAVKLTSMGYISSTDSTKTRTWEVLFESVLKAEMALATLQGAPIPGLSLSASIHDMHLSHVSEPSRLTHVPVPEVLPLYVSNIGGLPLSAQAIFLRSRIAGSIASVRINVDLGHGTPDILLHFWDVAGAKAGLKLYNETLAKHWARIINPRHLLCEITDIQLFAPRGHITGPTLDPLVFQTEILAAFSLFGNIVHLDLCMPSSSTAHVDVGFTNEERAFAARQAMDETVFCGCPMQVWLLEPDSLVPPALKPPSTSYAAFTTPSPSNSRRPSSDSRFSRSTSQDPSDTFSTASSTQSLERARSKLAEAERTLHDTRSELNKAARLEQEAAQERARLALMAEVALRELEEAKIRERAALQALHTAEETAAARSQLTRDLADAHRKALDALASAKATLRAAETHAAEDTRRRATANLTARMRQLDFEEKTRAVGQAAPSAPAGAAYEPNALQREQERCRVRDGALVSPRMPWDTQRALARYLAVSTEFDAIRFSEAQPLIFESVPWPVVLPPFSMTVEHVGWTTVEAFFTAIKLIMSVADYTNLITKSLRRFHPDEWSRRRLLDTVQDCDMREQLEAADRVVAQVLTLKWKETRKVTV